MKHYKVLTMTAALLLALSMATFAGDDKQETKQDAKQETKQDAKQETMKDAPKELKNQTHCPVMGGTIDSTVYTDIQGQRVYHCCPMCSASLKKDSDTYFKKAAADGILFENIQTTCPVSGEKLEDKSVYVDFEGRRVTFCCDNCQKTFNGDPAKFLSKLDAPDEKTEMKSMKMDKKATKTGHEGHNH